jgi:hypothetical protein
MSVEHVYCPCESDSTCPLAAEKASMDLTADAMKAVESSVDLCVSKLKPLIQASVSQDPSIAEEFLAQDRSKIEGAKVVLQAGKGSDDVAELNALKDSLARIANQADQGQVSHACLESGQSSFELRMISLDFFLVPSIESRLYPGS